MEWEWSIDTPFGHWHIFAYYLHGFVRVSPILFYSVLLMLLNRPTKFRKAAPSHCEDIIILVLEYRAKYYWRHEFSLISFNSFFIQIYCYKIGLQNFERLCTADAKIFWFWCYDIGLNITGGMSFNSNSFNHFYSVLLIILNRPTKFRKGSPSQCEDILILVLKYWNTVLNITGGMKFPSNFLILFLFWSTNAIK